MWLVEQCSQLGSLMTTQPRAAPPFSACSTENTEPQHAPERIRHHVGDSQRLVNQSELSGHGRGPCPGGIHLPLDLLQLLLDQALVALEVALGGSRTPWPSHGEHEQPEHNLAAEADPPPTLPLVG